MNFRDAEGITNERLTKLRFGLEIFAQSFSGGGGLSDQRIQTPQRLENSSTFDAEIKIKGDTKHGFIVPEITLKSRKKDRFKNFCNECGNGEHRQLVTWSLI